MQSLLRLVICIITLHPAIASAVTCTDILKSTYESQAYNNPNHGANFNITYLNENLGPAKTSIIKQQKYVWANYKIVVRDGKTLIAMGSAPEVLKNKNKDDFISPMPTLQQLIQVLGQPLTSSTEILTNYSWACQDTSSTLSVIADSGNTIIEYSGRLCLTATPCSYFGGGGNFPDKPKTTQTSNTTQQTPNATQQLYWNGRWDPQCAKCWPKPQTSSNNHCKPTDCIMQGQYRCQPQTPPLATENDPRIVSLIRSGQCVYQ